MKNSFKILLHLGFWMAYMILIIIIMFAALQDNTIPPEDYAYYFWFVSGVAIIPPLISFYAHYFYLFPKFLQKRKIALSVLVSISICAMAVITGFLTTKLAHQEAGQCFQTGFPYAGTITFVLAALFGIVSLVIKGFLTWYEELKLKEELIEKTHRMELALVKSQLDPHFLFNTINNIDVLITKDPEEASQYLIQLSDIMRFMLYETKFEEIPLSKELEYIEKYIELQKIRTANQNYVQYEVSGSPAEKKVAPMLFIPFIENAFKHSSNKKIDHAIAIDIQVEKDTVKFKCENKFETLNTSSNGQNGHEMNGLGNELIAKRLSLLYPEKHTLIVDRKDEKYSVELTIDHGKA